MAAEQIPPNSPEAEKSALGAALQSKDALADIVEIVKEEDFYNAANKDIFAVMRKMFRENKPVDIVTLSDELKKVKKLEAVGGRSYVAALTADIPSIVNAAEYAKIVAEKSSLRKLILTSDEVKTSCFSNDKDATAILDFAEKKIFAISQERQSNDYTRLSEIIKTNIDDIDKAIENRGKLMGVPTGFIELDRILGGLQKSDLVIVAARPAMGKTAFALNIAANAAIKGGAHVLIFSLEMSKEQLSQRLLSMEARVEMESIKKGKVEAEDWNRIMVASDNLYEADINIDDTADLSVFEIKNKCRRMKTEEGLDLIVIDYLQLMHGEGRIESRTQEISSLTRDLKLLAKELNCPVIVLSQLSRAPEARPNHRPMLADLRESGSIEQDADIVMFLYRDDYYNENSENPGVCEVNIAKHRSGPTGTVDLTWVARYTKFADRAVDTGIGE
ncbi:MAG: replicative DNA helicase [Eubacteriales bacterium]|nr:replicative DNA helicase [Eubacteriales bacterium]